MGVFPASCSPNPTHLCILSYLVRDTRYQPEAFQVVKSRKGPILKEGVVLTGQATMMALVVEVPLLGMGSILQLAGARE